MDSNDWKELLLEREQQFADALARCRTEEMESISHIVDRLEEIFQRMLATQAEMFADMEEKSERP